MTSENGCTHDVVSEQDRSRNTKKKLWLFGNRHLIFSKYRLISNLCYVEYIDTQHIMILGMEKCAYEENILSEFVANLSSPYIYTFQEPVSLYLAR